MEFLIPRVEANRILNRFRDKVIQFNLEHKLKEQDLIIDLLTINEGAFRLQIIEKVDIEEKKRYILYCESLKMKSKSSA